MPFPCWLAVFPKVFTMLTRENARNSWMTVEIHFCFLPFTIFRLASGMGDRTRNNKHRQHSINGASSSADCATCGKRSTAGPTSLPAAPNWLLQRYFCALIALNRQIQLSRGNPSPPNSETFGESLNRWFRYSYCGTRITNELIITQKQW